MRFPLEIRFKLLALAPQFAVRDAGGALIGVVRQKALALREAVTVFSDMERTQPRYRIQSDRVLDFSASYHISREGGANLGSLQRQGARSIWRATYEITGGFTVREANPWIKVSDSIVGGLPVIGFLSAIFFHPAYVVTRADGTAVMKATKRMAGFEGRFDVESLAPVDDTEAELIVLSLFMVILLERERG